VPVFGVTAVSSEQGVCPIHLGECSGGDGVGHPPVIRLTSEVQYPTRDSDGDTVRDQLAHERVEPFPGKFACDKYAAVRRSTSFSCSNNRLRLRSSRSSRNSADSAAVVPGRLPASISASRSQFCRQLSQDSKSSAICLIVTPALRRWVTATASSWNSSRMSLRHHRHPSSGTPRHHRSHATYSRSSHAPIPGSTLSRLVLIEFKATNAWCWGSG
jgi:hypothetical protein